jgi:hypothetical protein
MDERREEAIGETNSSEQVACSVMLKCSDPLKIKPDSDNVDRARHEELLRAHLSLLKAKEKRIAAADQIKKCQIKNIHDLFAWETEEAEAIFKAAFAEATERFLMVNKTCDDQPATYCDEKSNGRKVNKSKLPVSKKRVFSSTYLEKSISDAHRRYVRSKLHA